MSVKLWMELFLAKSRSIICIWKRVEASADPRGTPASISCQVSINHMYNSPRKDVHTEVHLEYLRLCSAIPDMCNVCQSAVDRSLLWCSRYLRTSKLMIFSMTLLIAYTRQLDDNWIPPSWTLIKGFNHQGKSSTSLSRTGA